MACGVTWPYWVWMYANGLLVGETPGASHLPGLLGPAVGAIAATALFEGRAGVAAFLRRLLRIPVPMLLAVLVLLAPVAILLVAVWILGVEAEARDFLLYPGIDHGRGVVAVVTTVVMVGGGVIAANWTWRKWNGKPVQNQKRIKG